MSTSSSFYATTLGLGRHTLLLARHGFGVCGIESTDSGLAHCSNWLAAEGLSADVRKGAVLALIPVACWSPDMWPRLRFDPIKLFDLKITDLLCLDEY